MATTSCCNLNDSADRGAAFDLLSWPVPADERLIAWQDMNAYHTTALFTESYFTAVQCRMCLCLIMTASGSCFGSDQAR